MAKIVAGKASIAMSADPVRTATNRPPDAPAIASPIRSTTWASLLARERTAIAWHSQDGQDGTLSIFSTKAKPRKTILLLRFLAAQKRARVKNAQNCFPIIFY